MNVFTPKLLIENAELTKEIASYGTSWYFAARTLGTLCGVILLAKFSEIYYYRINMFIVLIALSCIYWIHSQYIILLLVCIIAFAMSSIFAVIYSLALHTLPYKTNEISGLMITRDIRWLHHSSSHGSLRRLYRKPIRLHPCHANLCNLSNFMFVS